MKNITKTLQYLFTPLVSARTFIFAILTIALSFLFGLIPYSSIIYQYAQLESTTFTESFAYATGFLGEFLKMSLLESVYVIVTALLFSLNSVAAWVYFKKARKAGVLEIGSGVGAGFIAFLGIGCASCGAFLIGFILSLFGGQALLFSLPLGGVEFGIIGIIFMIFLFYRIARKFNQTVCAV